MTALGLNQKKQKNLHNFCRKRLQEVGLIEHYCLESQNMSLKIKPKKLNLEGDWSRDIQFVLYILVIRINIK